MESDSVVAGHLERAKKEDGTPALYFLVRLYELDAHGNPIKTGDWVDKKGDTRPAYKILYTLRLPESTLMKMSSGQSKRCLLFLKK